MMDASGTRPRPTTCDTVPSGLGKSITGDTLRTTVRSRRQKRRALQRAKKTGGKKERRNRRVTTRVKTLEEGQYKLFNILKEIQEWWEAQAIVAVIGQNASVDSEEEDIEEMEHEDGAKIVGEEVSQRFRAERLVFSATEHGDVEVDEALAAADDCECEEIEAYATSEHGEEPAPYANRAEGGVVIESEWEESEDFTMLVDAVMEYEAMSGMVGTAMSAMSQVKTEHNSLIRRMQGVEAIIHASMSKFNLRLQELEAVQKKSDDSDSADTATGKPTTQSIGIQSDIDGGEKVRSIGATTVEHAGGADRRALQQSGPSGMTDGASRSMGRGGDTKKGGWGKGGYFDGGGKISSREAKVEHDGGNDRRAHSGWAQSTEPSETTAGASRLRWNGNWWEEDYSRGGEKMGEFNPKTNRYERAEQAGEINRRDGPTGDTDGASRSTGRGGKKMRGGKK